MKVVPLLLLAACIDTRPPSLLPDSTKADPLTQEGCAIASRMCSQCHSLDRVLVARGSGRAGWSSYIEEMRLKPSSGITVADGDQILRCMLFLDTTNGDAP